MPKTPPLRIVGANKAPTDPLDPVGLGLMSVIPLVPESVLSKHKSLVPTDTRFRAAARLQQSLWRQDRDLPIGAYLDAGRKRIKLGSRITDNAGRDGANFLSPEIAALVRRECAYRELGALIEVDRLRANLLSSMPMCFNLFGPLKLDLRQAARFMAELFPGLMSEVRAIRFEHSPGRGKVSYTADYSAFDVAVYGLSPEGKRVLVAFEIKYSEAGGEPVPSRISERQLVIGVTGGLYDDPDDPALFGPAFQQLTRELNLAQAIVDHGDVDEAVFVLSGPRLNHHVAEMGEGFAQKLNAPIPFPGKARFAALTLERLVEALLAIGMVSHATAFHRRYLDFWQVDGQLELEAVEVVPSRTKAGKSKGSPEPVALPAP